MSSDSPLIVRVVARILPPDLHHLAGDMEEDYHERYDTRGLLHAQIGLLWQCLRSLPLFLFEAVKWITLMISHYLKTGMRVIRRHPGFSAINVIGLSAGMAVSLLIILFIVDQRSYDRFHEGADEVYRLTTVYEPSGGDASDWYATSPAGLGERVEEAVPGVDQTVQIVSGFHAEIRHGDETVPVGGIYAPPDFLDVFDFTLLSGDGPAALDTPGSILLTPEAAERIFGPDADPVGQAVTALGDRDYTVTGLIRPERRSHFRFEAVVASSTIEQAWSWRESLNWTYTYVRADADAMQRLTNVLSDFTDRYGETRTESESESRSGSLSEFRIQPITDINLGPALINEIGRVMPGFTAWFLAAFAAVLMIVAGFNYVSLTVARSLNRSREIGVRRVMGAGSGSIFHQFLLESVLMALLALLFAFGLMNWFLPRFNSLALVNLTESHIGLDVYGNIRVYMIFLAFSVGTGLLAGLYPARLFTSFEPIDSLADRRTPGRLSRQTLRKVITVAQFTFAIIFVITSIALVGQFRHMSTTDLGFNEQHVVNVALQDVPFDRLKTVLAENPHVSTIAAASRVPALGSINVVGVRGNSGSADVVAHEFSVDEHYVEAMDLSLLAGRNFDPRLASDSIDAVVIGRSSVRALGLESPEKAVGAMIRIEDDPFRVTGVIDDFISNNPAISGDPIVLRYRPEAFRYAVVRTVPGDLQSFVSDLKKTWSETGSLFSPKFRVFEEQLRSSDILLIFGDFLRVFGVIAAFTLIISCLGLLGLATYTARRRLREIGIRKMLGASRGNLVYVLSREYLVLVAIAVVIGAPLAWLLNSFWLSKLSNSIQPGPGMFVAAIGLTTVLALGAVASQTIRAARGSVVNTLNTE